MGLCSEGGLSLFTDLYELTMAQSYLEHGKTGKAVFSLFVRRLPKNRNFLVSCGLETLVNTLKNLRFSDDDINYLRSIGKFSDDFLSYLREYRFRGDLYAVPEGRIIFENEPIVQIEGSLPEVQILETLVMNLISFETLIASKAVRVRLSANGKSLVDFGCRRAHGTDAGVRSARACFVAGFDGTSNLLAGKRYNIPVFGTMAHSYIMVFDEEEYAFRSFAQSFPNSTILLIDTYDTVAGAHKVVKLAKEGVKVVGVRIDSGDVGKLSAEVRRILDQAGLRDVKILVSGGIDEYEVKELNSKGFPIDAFGVGTKVVTSADAPYLDIAYKLVEYEGKPKVKTSPGKKTFPFKRQIYRIYKDGLMSRDLVVPYKDTTEGEKLVEKILERGEAFTELSSLSDIRERLNADLERLPPDLRGIDKCSYEVVVL